MEKDTKQPVVKTTLKIFIISEKIIMNSCLLMEMISETIDSRLCKDIEIDKIVFSNEEAIVSLLNKELKGRSINNKLLLLSADNMELYVNNNNKSYWYSLSDFLVSDITDLNNMLCE